VRQLVWHEQVNVLQPILYNDVETRALLDANQAAWVTELPSSGYYQEVQLTLSAQCKAKRGYTNWLDRSLTVKLYDQNDRMKFVNRAVEAFDKLVRKRRAEVERSMREIFVGHAIR
jgi:thiaminase